MQKYRDCFSHGTFSRNTRNQLKQVFDALRELMDLPSIPVWGIVNYSDYSQLPLFTLAQVEADFRPRPHDLSY